MSAPKICLINVINKTFPSQNLPLNLAFLASYLVNKRILPKKNIYLIDPSLENPLLIIKSYKPDIIGLSVMTPLYRTAVDLGYKIKRITNSPLIIGGYHISALPNFLDYPFDIGIIGEGEKTLAELVKIWQRDGQYSQENLSHTRGIVYRNKDKCIITPKRPLIPTKEFVPIDWSFFPSERIGYYMVIAANGHSQMVKTTIIYTARGCPYNCSFCAHRLIWSGVRYNPIKMVGDEIEYLYKKFNINTFQIMDDTFGISKARIKQLIDELNRRTLLGKVRFTNLFVRANLVDEDFVQLLHQFGAYAVFIGAESGSNRILKQLKDGPLTVQQIKKAALLFMKYKIRAFVSFMLFSPSETMSDLQKTLSLAKWFSNKENTLGISYTVATPYPGTKLGNDAISQGIINPQLTNWKDFLMFHIRTRTPKMTPVLLNQQVTERERKKIWNIFSTYRATINQRYQKMPEWKRLQTLARRLNKQRERKLALKMRIHRFLLDPLASLNRLSKHPRYLSVIFKDFVYSIRKVT